MASEQGQEAMYSYQHSNSKGCRIHILYYINISVRIRYVDVNYKSGYVGYAICILVMRRQSHALPVEIGDTDQFHFKSYIPILLLFYLKVLSPQEPKNRLLFAYSVF